MLLNEQMSRQRFEGDMRSEVDKRWDALKVLYEDELTSMRDAMTVCSNCIRSTVLILRRRPLIRFA